MAGDNLNKEFNLVDQTNLFKINYYKKSANMYNSENVLQGRIRKRYDFTGRQRFVSTPMSFSGGVGSGSLPQSNAGKYEGAVILSNRVYAVAQIERESIKASANNAGAFVQATQETVRKTVESYMRNSSRILFGRGDGVLGSDDGTSAVDVSGDGGAGTPYVVTFSTTAGFKAVNFEEKDFVQVVTNYVAAFPSTGAVETALLEVVAVDEDARTVSLCGSSTRLDALTGAAPFGDTLDDALVMQGSFNNDPIGLDTIKEITLAGAPNTLYNIEIQRRWQMTTQDAGGAGITTDRMNAVMLEVERRFGKVPNMIMVHYNQFQKILALLEDQKVYNLPNRNIKGNMSFQGVEFMSTRGPIGIFVDRFCNEDEVWFLNDNFIEVHHRPDFGWFDDDGTVFLRTAATDSYEARYGGYYENYITPTAHGVLRNLTTA